MGATDLTRLTRRDFVKSGFVFGAGAAGLAAGYAAVPDVFARAVYAGKKDGVMNDRVLVKDQWTQQDFDTFDTYWRDAIRSEFFAEEFEAERHKIQASVQTARTKLKEPALTTKASKLTQPFRKMNACGSSAISINVLMSPLSLAWLMAAVSF